MARPKNPPFDYFTDPDWIALFNMYVSNECKGLSIRKRAELFVHLVPKVATEETRIDRLCRKYTKMTKIIEERERSRR